MKTENKKIGVILVVMAAIFWGISGTASQYLFQYLHVSPEWLTTVRLLTAGTILLLIAYKKEGSQIFHIWKSKSDVVSILIFGIIGMIGVQYTYLAAIKFGNAATATVLQYLGPVIVTSYYVVLEKRMPSLKETFALSFALIGTFLLVTHGNIGQLTISKAGFIWGILSAFGLAFYTIQPIPILRKWGSMIVVGWGMLVGGSVFSFVHAPWNFVGSWNGLATLFIFFIIICGTVLAFYSYLESLKYLTASETSLLATVEPLSAAITSVVFLGVAFGLLDWVGTFCIILTIVILTRR